MKNFVIFAFLIAGATAALPEQLTKGLMTSNVRLITDSIASVLEDVSDSIKEAGLDPVWIHHADAAYTLPVPVLFSAAGKIEGLLFKGLSNIVATRLSFTTLTLRLRLDLLLPLIELTLKNAESSVVVFGEQIDTSVAGRFAIRDITVEIDLRVRLGVISGISVSRLDANFRVGAIESDLAVSALGWDLSPAINHFLGATIHKKLNEFQPEINQLLEIVLTDLINANL